MKDTPLQGDVSASYLVGCGGLCLGRGGLCRRGGGDDFRVERGLLAVPRQASVDSQLPRNAHRGLRYERPEHRRQVVTRDTITAEANVHRLRVANRPIDL